MALAGAWLGLVYAQFMTIFRAATPASDCSIAASWNTSIIGDSSLTVIGVAVAAISGYTLCRSQTNWGRGTLIASLALCSALALLLTLTAFFYVWVGLDRAGTGADGLSPSLMVVSLCSAVIPALAAVSTLIACWLLRWSRVRPQVGALMACLVPVFWYMLTVGIRLVAVIIFCN